jgi:hypothetical protein
MREKKMGTEIILLYFYLSYSFVHKFISYWYLRIFLVLSPLFQQIFEVAHIWTPLTRGDYFDWLYKN